MSTRLRLTIFVLLLTLTACFGRTILKENQQKWAEQKITHYKFQLTISCSCGWYTLMPLNIEVKDGQAVSITDKKGQPIPADFAKDFNQGTTVERLFAIIDEELGSTDRMRVSYDPRLGYPTKIDIDVPNTFDLGVSYYINGLEVLK
jgi:hypothetical protein